MAETHKCAGEIHAGKAEECQIAACAIGRILPKFWPPWSQDDERRVADDERRVADPLPADERALARIRELEAEAARERRISDALLSVIEAGR